MGSDVVIKAINNLDLKTLSLENVELLQKMIPTEQESKLYKDFVIEKKNVNLLTEEDKFVLNLTKVERIGSKLSIMNYMGNFFDCIHLISPVSSLPRSACVILTHCMHFAANLLDHIGLNVRQVIDEVQSDAGSGSGIWKLSQQQQARPGLWI